MFALGIETDAEYFHMALRCPHDIHANTEFIQFLVDRGYLVEQSTPEPGSLIAYLEAGKFCHMGRLTDSGRVQSKWGIGHLYDHSTFETPISYGHAVQFFRPIKRDPVLDAFFEFAELHGVSFGDTDG